MTARSEAEVRRALRAEIAADEPVTERDLDALSRRPTTRAECRAGERPCPWVGCRHHLMLEVSPKTGAIRLRWPDVESMPETCSLDLAERRPMDGPLIGRAAGYSKQAADMILIHAVRRLRAKLIAAGIDGDLALSDEVPRARPSRSMRARAE